jgi:hypothetical protein
MEQNSLQPELSPVRHLLRNFRPAASPNLEPRRGPAFVAGGGMFTIGAGACEPRSYPAASLGVRRFGNRVRMYCRIQLLLFRATTWANGSSLRITTRLPARGLL